MRASGRAQGRAGDPPGAGRSGQAGKHGPRPRGPTFKSAQGRAGYCSGTGIKSMSNASFLTC